MKVKGASSSIFLISEKYFHQKGIDFIFKWF